MSCLETWTEETKEDCIDMERMVAVISEIDDKLHSILNRLDQIENESKKSG